ncbi:MAG: hypothetical protein BJ554DRAFT_5252, partial [Olpidium bornovanus]
LATRRRITGYVFRHRQTLITWRSGCQSCTALSRKVMAANEPCREVAWLQQISTDILVRVGGMLLANSLQIDNCSANEIANDSNRLFFIYTCVNGQGRGIIRIMHVASAGNPADGFTEGLHGSHCLGSDLASRSSNASKETGLPATESLLPGAPPVINKETKLPPDWPVAGGQSPAHFGKFAALCGKLLLLHTVYSLLAATISTWRAGVVRCGTLASALADARMAALADVLFNEPLTRWGRAAPPGRPVRSIHLHQTFTFAIRLHQTKTNHTLLRLAPPFLPFDNGDDDDDDDDDDDGGDDDDEDDNQRKRSEQTKSAAMGTVFFGGLPHYYRTRDLERLIARYGPCSNVDLKVRKAGR